jgi:hypothetical protein
MKKQPALFLVLLLPLAGCRHGWRIAGPQITGGGAPPPDKVTCIVVIEEEKGVDALKVAAEICKDVEKSKTP